jgi:phenylalanyl-tRNA synthetase alpha chain
MKEEQIIESLSPIEQKTLKALNEKEQTQEEIRKKTGQDNTTILRALTFLKNKGLVTTTTETTTTIQLGILGLHYKKNQLPERTLLNCIQEKRSIPIGEVGNTCKLNENETKAAIGELKKKQQISIQQGKIHYEPKEQATEKTPEEQLLEKLPLQEQELTEKEQQVYKQLQKRKELVEKEETHNTKAKLTTLGKKYRKASTNQNS